MTNFKLRSFLRESGMRFILCGIFSIGAGLGNGLLLVIASEIIGNNRLGSFYMIAAFLAVVIGTQILRYFADVKTIIIAEELTSEMQLTILSDLRECSLSEFEQLGLSKIHTALSSDCATITRCTPYIVKMGASGITALVCLCYLAWLSPFIFFLVLITLLIGTSVYLLRQHVAHEGITLARKHSNKSHAAILDFLDGFKELKVNALKARDLFKNQLQPKIHETRDLKINAGQRIQLNHSLGQTLFFSLLGIILFYLPYRHPDNPLLVSQIAVILLYIMGPGSQLLFGSLHLVRLRVAMENIELLRQNVKSHRNTHGHNDSDAELKRFGSFEEITLKDVSYTYQSHPDQPPFAIGPINLSIKRGEVLFITGGNGSGKTTLSKILLGLYTVQEGCICVDDTTITQEHAEAYRHLFAPVFNDFHLFDSLHGITDPGNEHIEKILSFLQLSGRLTITDRKFSSTDFSAGQRRRIALLTAILDDNPILLLDEMTADQESSFRDYFYHEFIPMMKEQGKTLIVITHDDRYFHLSDRLIKLEYGRLVEDSGNVD